MTNPKIGLEEGVNILVMMPFKIFGSNLDFSENLNEIEKLFENIITIKLVENDDANFLFPEPIARLKNRFIASAKIEITKDNDTKESYEDYKSALTQATNEIISITEQIVYYDYGYGYVLSAIKYKTNDHNLNICISNVNIAREKLINIKEGKGFYLQNQIKTLFTQTRSKADAVDPFTYGFSISLIINKANESSRLNGTEIELFGMSKDFCIEGISAKNVKEFKTEKINGLCYLNHGFTGGFIVLDQSFNVDITEKIIAFHNFLYLMILIVMDLTEITHKKRREILVEQVVIKNKKDEKKQRQSLVVLKKLRDLCDIILLEAQPAVVCGTELEYAIYGKAWKLGEFGEYTNILKKQSEYLSRSIDELDVLIQDHQTAETNKSLFGITALSIFATAFSLVTFLGGQTRLLECEPYMNECFIKSSLSFLASCWFFAYVAYKTVDLLEYIKDKINR